MTSAPTTGIDTSGSFSPAASPSRTTGGGGSFSWAVGVYAAPRAERTLFQTVGSLRAAGWEPTVQAEPGTLVPPGARTVFNAYRKGVVHNFRALAERLLAEYPDADVILTAQDDALFHPDSRAFVESVLWPDDDAAFLSLYCSRAHSMAPDKSVLPPGVRRVSAPYVWSDLALVWPRRVLEEYVASSLLRNWRGTPGDLRNAARKAAKAATGLSPYLRNLVLSGARVSLRKGNPGRIPYPRGSDVAAGMFAHRTHRSMWVVDPSPVTHTAILSTIPGHRDNTGNRNALRPADPARPLREQVFPACQANDLVHTPPIEGA